MIYIRIHIQVLYMCEYDFGEPGQLDDEGDLLGSEALEKRVSHLDRKHLHGTKNLKIVNFTVQKIENLYRRRGHLGEFSFSKKLISLLKFYRNTLEGRLREFFFEMDQHFCRHLQGI